MKIGNSSVLSRASDAARCVACLGVRSVRDLFTKPEWRKSWQELDGGRE